MSPNENSKSEQLSQSIDAEIERKLSERLRELQEGLDERVQEKIQGDREFIKDTIGVAFKVAGLAVALVVVLLGILGWKTFADVHKAMTDAATERAQRYFDNQEGRNIIDSAIDRSVLNSYLIQMALVDADKSLRQQFRGIENPDVNRLLRIVNRAEMKDTTNVDSATNLLMKGARQEMISEVGGAFADLIAAKGKDLKWIESNSWKRRRLLDKLNETRFSDDQVKTACRELLSTAAEKV